MGYKIRLQYQREYRHTLTTHSCVEVMMKGGNKGVGGEGMNKDDRLKMVD